MRYNGKSVRVSIKYGGFQGDQIAKSGPSLARRYTLFIFPEKKIEMLLYSLLASKVIPLVPVFPC